MAERIGTLIVGSGINGSGVAHYLRGEGYGERVVVLDPRGLAQGMTSLAVGGFRNLRGHEVSRRIMDRARHVLRDLHEGGVDFGYRAAGYLIALPVDVWERRDEMAAAFEGSGVRLEFLATEAVRERFLPGYREDVEPDADLSDALIEAAADAGLGNLPGLLRRGGVCPASLKDLLFHLEDEVLRRGADLMGMRPVGGFVFGPDCGFFNPFDLALWYAARARAEGVEFRLDDHAEVDRLLVRGAACRGVVLRSGEEIEADRVVLAAGAHSVEILRRTGLSEFLLYPVEPIKRQLFTTPSVPGCTHDRMPFSVIDPNGVYFKPEGKVSVWGRALRAEPGFDVRPENAFFFQFILPVLEARFANTSSVRLQEQSSMAGLYDDNRFDHNVIAGPNPFLENLVDCCGCSGHGAMEAPVITRALAEWIVHGSYRTVDITALGFDRVFSGRPVRETIQF